MSLLLLGSCRLGRVIFIGQAVRGRLQRAGAAAVWDTVLRFLKTDLRWTVLISVLVAFGGWLAGPARYAVWIRSTCAKGGRWVAAQSRELSSGAGRAAAESSRVRRSGGWIVEHINGLRIVGVVVAGLILRLRRQPHGVEPAGDRDRAGRVSRAAATGGGVGPQGGGTGSDRDLRDRLSPSCSGGSCLRRMITDRTTRLRSGPLPLVADVTRPQAVSAGCSVPVGGLGREVAGKDAGERRTAHVEELIAMAEITLILGSVGLLMARMQRLVLPCGAAGRPPTFERVPVSTARSAHVVRRADERTEAL